VSTQFNCRTSCLSFLDDIAEAGPSTDANPSLQDTEAADKVDSPLPAAAEPLPPPPLEAQIEQQLKEPPPPKTLLTEILSELGEDDEDELTHKTSEQKSESCSNSIFSPRSSHTHTSTSEQQQH
jgi:hypothetical protein